MTTHAPPATSNAPTPTSSFKRRRLSAQKNKEELAYTASTIQKKAFLLGDRREHALPIGCGVDVCTVKLVTAAEYDDDRWSSSSSDEWRQLQSNQLQQQQQQGQQEEDCKCKDEMGEFSSSSNNNMNDAAVTEMQMYANLVKSTRQSYYTDDLALATKSTSKRRSTATASNITTINGNLRLSSPNSSEDNSTWSSSLLEDTTTTLNDLNANHTKKNIDNDNRSDGQSSNMGNYGWYSSDDSDSSSSSDDDDDDDDENESKTYEENEIEIRQQCDLGHQQVQEQQRGHDKVDSSRLYCMDEPYSVVG